MFRRLADVGMMSTMRAWLVLISVGWVAFAVGSFTNERGWPSRLVGVFGVATALATVWLMFAPGSKHAYRWGGWLAVGGLFFRVSSLAFGFEPYGSQAVWGIYTILSAVYVRWWLTDVARWHLDPFSARPATEAI